MGKFLPGRLIPIRYLTRILLFVFPHCDPTQDLIPYIEQRDHDNDGETHVVIFTFGYEGWIRKNLSDIAEHFEG